MGDVKVGTYRSYEKTFNVNSADEFILAEAAWLRLANSPSITPVEAAGYNSNGQEVPLMDSGCGGASIPLNPIPPDKVNFTMGTVEGGILPVTATINLESRVAKGAPCPSTPET